MFIEKLFEEDLNNLRNKEKQRIQQQIEAIKLKNKPEVNETKEKEESKTDKETSFEEVNQEKKETDKEEEEKNSTIKLVCLETIGKCWPYSTETQGY
jgi:hypothetical protein